MLGSNPLIHVIEGFFRRIWKEKVGRIGSPKHGVFVVRFHDVETRDSIMNGGFIFFNRRSDIMKPWDSKINFQVMSGTYLDSACEFEFEILG